MLNPQPILLAGGVWTTRPSFSVSFIWIALRVCETFLEDLVNDDLLSRANRPPALSAPALVADSIIPERRPAARAQAQDL